MSKIDYRSIKQADLTNDIKGFKKSSTLYNDVLNGYLAVCVYHSIKDGQITPAITLIDSCLPSLKGEVIEYLTRYGFMSWSDKKGLQYSREAGNALVKEAKAAGFDDDSGIKAFRKMRADEIFEALPELSEVPSKPKQYKDLPLLKALKDLLRKVDEVKAAGKSVFADDEGKLLLTQLETYVATHA